MSGAHVFIDRSQFPENVRRDLIESLRARAINHKFHYDSYKQAAKWLALHQAYSPARNDESCLRIYDAAFSAVAVAERSDFIHLVALGCGGGQKEARLLEMLQNAGRKTSYTPSDVSLPMVITALSSATPFLHDTQCHAVVCDLAGAENLGATFDQFEFQAPRIVTLFGVLPNFEPDALLVQLTHLLRPNDLLLLSANLAPGFDYAAGVRAVLPQYKNDLTRDWLLTLLLDLGFERHDGELDFTIESDERQLLRITAHFELIQSREIRVLGQLLSFTRGERLRVFFSYRHTKTTIHSLMREHGFVIDDQWLNDTGEEGVFLCRKSKSS